jgi:hypothetical protein
LVSKLSGGGGGNSVSEFYSSFNESRELEDGSFRFVGRRTGVLGVLKLKLENSDDVGVVLGHYEGLPWCDIITEVRYESLWKIYDAYRGSSHVDRLDRITKALQTGMTVSVSIRKKGKEQRASEGDYDREYAVYIFADETLQR